MPNASSPLQHPVLLHPGPGLDLDFRLRLLITWSLHAQALGPRRTPDHLVIAVLVRGKALAAPALPEIDINSRNPLARGIRHPAVNHPSRLQDKVELLRLRLLKRHVLLRLGKPFRAHADEIGPAVQASNSKTALAVQGITLALVALPDDQAPALHRLAPPVRL